MVDVTGQPIGALAGETGRIHPAGRRRTNWTPYLFIVPALLIVLAVAVYPIGYEIYLSFTDWYLLKNPDPIWQGLGGYRRLLSDPVIWDSLRLTAYWTIGTVALEYLLALPLAMLLNRRSALNGVLTAVILLPWVTPGIVVAYTFRWLLDGQYGIIHAILQSLHIVGERSVLSNPDLALPTLIVISAWKGAPFMVVALLATMKSIPRELYEAAALDGAGLWKQFRDITLPLVRRVSIVLSLVLGILAFYSFDIIWVMTQGGPAGSTQLIGVYLFRSFFERLEFSYAATMGVSMLVLLVIFSTLYLRLAGREEADR